MRIAALQMVSTSSIEQNLSAAARLIASAAEAGATLVVLPEVFATLEGLSPLADVGERMREADAFQKAHESSGEKESQESQESQPDQHTTTAINTNNRKTARNSNI